MTTRQHEMTYMHRHLAIGWWSLLLFLTLGIGLEALHGFKVAWYLNVGMETRRLMWRLAHAHGTFLALVHIALAMSIYMLRTDPASASSTASSSSAEESAKRSSRKKSKGARKSVANVSEPTAWYLWPSVLLSGASVGVPGGFFLGGFAVRGGDPGIGVLILPVGALLLLVAVLTVALGVSRAKLLQTKPAQTLDP